MTTGQGLHLGPGENLQSSQRQFLQRLISALMNAARKRGVRDQDIAEWMLSLSVRWLAAHGVSKPNLHLWVDHELTSGPKLAPLVAAAAAPNDFGGQRC